MKTGRSSFILYPSSFILHPSSFILYPSSSPEAGGRPYQRRRPDLGSQRVHARVRGEHVPNAGAVALAVESISATHSEREPEIVRPRRLDARVVELVPSQGFPHTVEGVVLHRFEHRVAVPLRLRSEDEDHGQHARHGVFLLVDHELLTQEHGPATLG